MNPLSKQYAGQWRKWIVLPALFLPLCVKAGPILDPWLLEQKKVLTKTYTVTPKDRLFLSNQFGDVRIQLWDKSEVRADIVVTAAGNSAQEVQQTLNQVQIQDEHHSDVIRIVTQYEVQSPPPPNSVWAWTDWSSRRSEETPRTVKIQYTVTMPRWMSLEVRNRFGNTFIPDFSAPISIRSAHGTVSAGRLNGQNTAIQVNYGEAIIKAVEKGRLAFEHARLRLDKAGDLHLNNKDGNLHIREVDKLNAELSYTTGQIEHLKESAQMQLRYLSNFRLPALPEGIKNVQINSEFSDLRMPVTSATNVDFDITVNFADFRAPEERVSFSRKDEESSDKRKTKTYVGKVGKGGGTVKITSTYGTVKFED